MGNSTRSIDESQHCNRHSPWGNGRVVLSRQYLRGLEDQWLTLVDLRKTYALPALPRSTRALTAVCVLSWLWKEHSLVRRRPASAHDSKSLLYPLVLRSSKML